MKPTRIIIIGMSCSGKTTLGKQLANYLGIPVLDLDEISWLPNWVERPRGEFKEMLRQFVNDNESWIISGNYTSHTLDISWPLATHIVRLHYPLLVILYRYFTRTLKRIRTQEPVCGGNFETWHNTFFADEPLLPWILNGYKRVNRKFDEFQQNDFKDKQWLVVTNYKQQDNITGSIAQQIAQNLSR